jgi:hypothetical protein
MYIATLVRVCLRIKRAFILHFSLFCIILQIPEENKYFSKIIEFLQDVWYVSLVSMSASAEVLELILRGCRVRLFVSLAVNEF